MRNCLEGMSSLFNGKKLSPICNIILNMDCTSKSNPSLVAASGILRHNDGTFTKGFTHYLGDNNSNLLGKLCLFFSLFQQPLIWVSLFFLFKVTLQLSFLWVKVLCSPDIGYCKVYTTTYNPKSYQDNSFFRGVNQVADSLADLSCHLQASLIFPSLTDYPHRIQGLIHLDQQEVPYIRIVSQ